MTINREHGEAGAQAEGAHGGTHSHDASVDSLPHLDPEERRKREQTRQDALRETQRRLREIKQVVETKEVPSDAETVLKSGALLGFWGAVWEAPRKVIKETNHGISSVFTGIENWGQKQMKKHLPWMKWMPFGIGRWLFKKIEKSSRELQEEEKKKKEREKKKKKVQGGSVKDLVRQGIPKKMAQAIVKGLDVGGVDKDADKKDDSGDGDKADKAS